MEFCKNEAESKEITCPLRNPIKICRTFHCAFWKWRNEFSSIAKEQRFGYCGLVGKDPEED